MKKIFNLKRLFVVALLLFAGFLLTACEPKAEADGVVTVIVINYEEEEIFNKEVEFFIGDTLVELLQNHKELLVLGETGEYGFFISSIKGIEASSYTNAFWNFKVNGVDSMVGISATPLTDKDVYTFALISWE